jgi:outer membrane protein OmpA-like peptidoglycan-associated protein
MRRRFVKYVMVAGLALALAACQSPPVKPGLTAEQLQVLNSYGFEDMDGDWALQMPSKLLFAVDTDQLDARQAEYVSELAQALLKVNIRTVRVEGHTDDTGTVAHNQKLSERRARRVAEELIKAGMDASLVSTRGWGNTKPLPMASGQNARKENRRVAIIIPAVGG